jgi:putative SOS response-associated peptidase YedK
LQFCTTMCFYVNVNIEKEKLKKNLPFVKKINSNFNGSSLSQNELSAFTFPDLPILLFQKDDYVISDFKWGLIPEWVSPNDMNEFRKNTLNARIETIDEKKSFQNYTHQKGILTLNGFYEWQHIGKHKNKFYIHSSSQDFIYVAVIHHTYLFENKEINTFSMITTNANKLMSEIHNTKKRMPLMLNKSYIRDWLNPKFGINDIMLDIESNMNHDLKAELISKPLEQISLF